MSTLIGKKAPFFKTTAVKGNQFIQDFSLEQFLGKKVVLFFYPLDFTFICPTELHAFQEKMAEFEARNTQIIACSVDSPYSHAAWLNTPKKLGGIQGIEYPIISDIHKKISHQFGCINEEEGIAFRGLFILDTNGIVRHQLINDLFIGRSVEEVLRVLDAIDFHAENGFVCPANWKKGENAIETNLESLKSYFSN